MDKVTVGADTDFDIKYRPKTLDEIVGQDAAVACIKGWAHVPRAALFHGPSGCLRGDTELYDPSDGTLMSIRERWTKGLPFCVYSLDARGRTTVSSAMPPVRYGPKPMFRVETNESVFYVTGDHRMRTLTGGYEPVLSLLRRMPTSGGIRLLSTSGPVRSTRISGGRRSTQTALGSRSGYLPSVRSCGGPLPSVSDGDRPLIPSRVGAPVRTPFGSPGGKEVARKRTRARPSSCLRSTRGSSPSSFPCLASPSPFVLTNLSHVFGWSEISRPGDWWTSRSGTVLGSYRPVPRSTCGSDTTACSSFSDKRLLARDPPTTGELVTGWTMIKSIVPSGDPA